MPCFQQVLLNSQQAGIRIRIHQMYRSLSRRQNALTHVSQIMNFRKSNLWPAFLAPFVFSVWQDSGLFQNGPATEPWHHRLLNCPCRNPDLNQVNIGDGWAKDKGDIAIYHKGATECIRSYPAVKTKEGRSGQQCCFDENGNLITAGAGAGTPDKVSTCGGEDSKGIMTIQILTVVGHYYKDVRPWKRMDAQNAAWKKYNTLWVPNNGNGCKQNMR